VNPPDALIGVAAEIIAFITLKLCAEGRNSQFLAKALKLPTVPCTVLFFTINTVSKFQYTPYDRIIYTVMFRRRPYRIPYIDIPGYNRMKTYDIIVSNKCMGERGGVGVWPLTCPIKHVAQQGGLEQRWMCLEWSRLKLKSQKEKVFVCFVCYSYGPQQGPDRQNKN